MVDMNTHMSLQSVPIPEMAFLNSHSASDLDVVSQSLHPCVCVDYHTHVLHVTIMPCVAVCTLSHVAVVNTHLMLLSASIPVMALFNSHIHAILTIPERALIHTHMSCDSRLYDVVSSQ